MAEAITIGTASQIGKFNVELRAIPRMKISESPGKKEPRIVAVSMKRISATPRTASAPKDSIRDCGSSNEKLAGDTRLNHFHSTSIELQKLGVVSRPRLI